MEKLFLSVKLVETFRIIKPRMRAHFSSCIKNVTNECVDVEASFSSERQAKANLNQNKRCLDREFYEEDDHKKARFLQGNIIKYVSKTSDEDKKKIDLTVANFLCLQYII